MMAGWEKLKGQQRNLKCWALMRTQQGCASSPTQLTGTDFGAQSHSVAVKLSACTNPPPQAAQEFVLPKNTQPKPKAAFVAV